LIYDTASFCYLLGAGGAGGGGGGAMCRGAQPVLITANVAISSKNPVSFFMVYGFYNTTAKNACCFKCQIF